MADKLMRIQGMTCAHCEWTVAKALKAAGAHDVVADWSAGHAQLDTATASEEELSAAVEEAGYRVLSIESVRAGESVVTPVVRDNSHQYDLVVLGSGSAAFAAPITATGAWARVAVRSPTLWVEHASGRRRGPCRRHLAHDQPKGLGGG